VSAHVLTPGQASLFSALTSAFIVGIKPELHVDPNEESANLLRILVRLSRGYFADNSPENTSLPIWPGPPHMIVQAQKALFASLVASLAPVFITIFAKQWLNLYTLADVRGSTIERCQKRQRKLDNITWRLSVLIDVLSLSLQLAFLLLGYAISLYLWDLGSGIAFVFASITGVITVINVYTIWTALSDPSCLYQSPIFFAISHSYRVLLQVLLHPSDLAVSSRRSETVSMAQANTKARDSWQSRDRIAHFLKEVLHESPRTLTADCFRLRNVALRVLIIGSMTNGRLPGGSSTPEQDALDMPCVSWVLRISPERDFQLSALEYLATMETLTGFRPALVANCFDILIDCVKVIKHNVVVTGGLEQLAMASAICYLRTFSHLLVVDPTSEVLGDVRQRHSRTFPPETDFEGFPFHPTLGAIHRLLNSDRGHRQRARVEWRDYKPPGHEHPAVARALTELAQSEYRSSERQEKVPRWIIRFTLHSLSLDPLPPTPIVIDCLSIIAIDLGCEVPNTRATALSERYAPTYQTPASLTKNQRATRRGFEVDNSRAQSHG